MSHEVHPAALGDRRVEDGDEVVHEQLDAVVLRPVGYVGRAGAADVVGDHVHPRAGQPTGERAPHVLAVGVPVDEHHVLGPRLVRRCAVLPDGQAEACGRDSPAVLRCVLLGAVGTRHVTDPTW